MSNLYLSKVNGQNGTEQKTIKRIYTTKQINVLIQSNQCTLSEDADLLNINSHWSFATTFYLAIHRNLNIMDNSFAFSFVNRITT